MTNTDDKEIDSGLFAVIRVRGRVDVRPDVRHTLTSLRLHRPNHCVLLKKDSTTKGMLHVVKDWTTWGEISKETLLELIEKRATRPGGKRGLREDEVKETTAYESMDDLIESLLTTKVSIKNIKGIKPIFRLHPPRKGYSGIKKAYTQGGAVGYRGNAINKLLRQMM